MTNNSLNLCKDNDIDPKKTIIFKDNMNRVVTILWDVPTKGYAEGYVAVTFYDDDYAKQTMLFTTMSKLMNKPDYNFEVEDLIKDSNNNRYIIWKNPDGRLHYMNCLTGANGSLISLYAKNPKDLEKIGTIAP